MKLTDASNNLALLSILLKYIQQVQPIPFVDLTPTKLPYSPGLYVISDENGEIIRAGRTDKQTLSDRIYQNHLMGNQSGNLRIQLVDAGICPNMDSAKNWIRQHFCVHVVKSDWLTQNGLDMRWAEHFLLAILQPRFSN